MRQTKKSAKPKSRTQSVAASAFAEVAVANCPFTIGQSYFIRTVTYHLVGRVKAIVGTNLILESASWVADSGRFMQAIKNGTLNEVEPVGDAIVNMTSYTDAFPWNHALPETQK